MLGTLRNQPVVVLLIWGALAFEAAAAAFEGRWQLVFVAFATFALSLLPILFARRFGIKVPTSFYVFIVLFVFASIFLGEAFDFYNRYWWWDLLLHSGSAMAFGLVGVLFMLMLFGSDRYAAPPWAVAFFAFCFAMTVGAVWEIFEYAMDRNFGLNMQKSGLDDTMGDLVVNAVGAAIGAAAGFFYLKGQELGGLTAPLRDFVRSNRGLFRRARR